ncbi:hypothetical protein MHYP_G00335590 [Metynnis hypsauchen]
MLDAATRLEVLATEKWALCGSCAGWDDGQDGQLFSGNSVMLPLDLSLWAERLCWMQPQDWRCWLPRSGHSVALVLVGMMDRMVNSSACLSLWAPFSRS